MQIVTKLTNPKVQEDMWTYTRGRNTSAVKLVSVMNRAEVLLWCGNWRDTINPLNTPGVVLDNLYILYQCVTELQVSSDLSQRGTTYIQNICDVSGGRHIIIVLYYCLPSNK